MADTSRTLKVVFDGAVSGLVSAAAKAKAAVQSVGNSTAGLEKVTQAFDGIGAKTKQVGADFDKLSFGLANLTKTFGKASLITSGVAAAGGLAGQAFAGALPVMTAFGAIAGTVAIGIQAIKNETGQLLTPFGHLKLAVEQTFTKGFKPAMADVARTIPKLTDGFVAIAERINDTVQQLTEFGSSARGVLLLQSALRGTAEFIAGINDGLVVFIEGWLTAVAAAEPEMRAFGESIGNVFANIGNTLERVSNDEFGTFAKAVAGLSAVINGIGAILGEVIDLFIRLGAAIGPGLGDVLYGVANALMVASPGLVDLATAVGALLTAVAPMVPVLGQLANAFATQLAGAIRGVTPYVESFAIFLIEHPAIVTAAATAILGLSLALRTLKSALQIVAFVKALNVALSAVAVATTAAGTKMALLALVMKRLLIAVAAAAAIDVLVGAMKGYNEEQNKAFEQGGFGEDIKQFIAEFKVEPLQAIGKEIRASLTPPAETQGLWQRISQSFQTDFVDVFAAAPSKIKESFQTDFLDVFTNLGTQIGTFATDAWTSFTTATSSGIESAVSVVTTLPGRIGTAIASFGTDLYNKAVTAWQQFRDGALAKFDEIDGDARTLPGRIGFAIGSLIGMAAKWAIDTWQSFKTTSSTKFTEIVADVQALPGRIATAISNLVTTLTQKAVEAWQAFKVAATAKGNEILADVRAFPGKVATAIANLVSTLSQKAVESWQAFKVAAIAKGNEIIADARALPGKISAAVVALVALLRQRATEAWNSFLASCRAGAASAVAFVRGIPGMIVSAIGNLGGLLVGAGRAVINGLLSGIRAGVQAMYDFVSGIAAGIAARKGPLTYDRKLLVPAGLAIMQGLQNGLARGYADVLSQVADMAGGISGQLATEVGSLGTLNPAGLSATRPATASETAAAFAATPAPVTYVTVKIGDTELRGIVDTQVESTNREVARVVGAGAGR